MVCIFKKPPLALGIVDKMGQREEVERPSGCCSPTWAAGVALLLAGGMWAEICRRANGFLEVWRWEYQACREVVTGMSLKGENRTFMEGGLQGGSVGLRGWSWEEEWGLVTLQGKWSAWHGRDQLGSSFTQSREGHGLRIGRSCKLSAGSVSLMVKCDDNCLMRPLGAREKIMPGIHWAWC